MMVLPDIEALHAQLLGCMGVLLVLRDAQAPPQPPPGQPGSPSAYVQATPEIFLAVRPLPASDAGGCEVVAFNGHVDLGTGIRTALMQIVAEELEVPMDRVTMVLGHTGATPNQGPTIASASIQVSAVPLRRAAAQARERLIELAATRWNVQAQDVQANTDEIRWRNAGHTRRISYRELLDGRQEHLHLSEQVKLKPASAYHLVGHSAARVDIPGKATGQLCFVHDVRMPGMRHGRVVRPPYAGRDAGAFIGCSLVDVDLASVLHLPGDIRVVVDGDFVGVVAEREEQAIAAMRALKVRWRTPPPAPDLQDLEAALRNNPSKARQLCSDPGVAQRLEDAPARLRCTYVWSYQMHASIGPSCAVASHAGGRLTVWSGTQNPHMLRVDLRRLTKIGEGEIEIIRLEASGCYGRNCADDVCGDAALLAMAVGAPVRVQLTREQEHMWEPKGAAQLMDVDAGFDVDGELLAYDFAVRYPSNDAPLMSLLLTGRLAANPRTLEMGDRTAVPPYRYASQRIVCHDMAPMVRASWLRGVSALPNSFAHDSMIDELAFAVGVDPLDFRLRHIDDARAADLLVATAGKAGWHSGRQGSRGRADAAGLLRGSGVAYARYVHSAFPGFGAAWSAWVVSLAVDIRTGRVRIERVVVGQDTGMMVNPAGVRHQIHGNVIQTLSRALIEEVSFGPLGVTSREWGTYPILGFADLPEIDVVLMPRQEEPPMGGGESASVPGAAAIANALFDAVGVRFRSPPFTADKVLRGLA